MVMVQTNAGALILAAKTHTTAAKRADSPETGNFSDFGSYIMYG